YPDDRGIFWRSNDLRRHLSRGGDHARDVRPRNDRGGSGGRGAEAIAVEIAHTAFHYGAAALSNAFAANGADEYDRAGMDIREAGGHCDPGYIDHTLGV